jgi:hypothetical protein
MGVQIFSGLEWGWQTERHSAAEECVHLEADNKNHNP